MSIFRNLRPCFLGFCLIISISTLQSLYVGQWANPQGIPACGWVTGAVRTVVFLGMAALSSRVTNLSSHRVPLWVACAFCTAGAVMTMGSATIDPSFPWLPATYVTGLAIGAAGYALFYLYWIELYARMDLMHVIVYFALVHLLSATISLVISSLASQVVMFACIVLMPIVSQVLYMKSLRESSGLSFMQGETPSSGWSIPWRPIVLLGTYTFANSFVRHFLGNSLKGLVLVGVILAASVAIALLASRRERLGLRTLYSASLPLIVAASLCVLVALPGFGTLGGALSNAAYTLFSIYATVLLCNVAYRDGVSPLWLFGFACASISTGTLASSLLTNKVDFISSEPAVLTLAISAVIMVFVCLYVAFDSSKETAKAWGITREGSDCDNSKAVPLEERCASLARLYGLTRREEEVMALLAHDASYSQVEAELSIANSTLKTHVRHIYSKLGVADKRELVELVGSRR